MNFRAATTLACVLAIGTTTPAAAQDAATPITSDNVSHVKRIAYEARNGTVPNYGTDIEFAKISGREYAFAGSYRNGLQIVDIADPKRASIVGRYDCGITQGDVQVFRQADETGRTFITYTSDTFGDGTSTCYREAAALGFDVRKTNGSGRNGTFIADVTDPRNPVTVSFVPYTKGSHNMTVHPSGNWLYNSNSDLITSAAGAVTGSGGPAIEYTDISDPSKPGATKTLALPVRPGLGTESHDITFNAAGSRAYSAALSQGVIIDTTNPGAPRIVTSFLNPGINVWHQADPFTLTDATGRKRDYLMVEDEYAGAAGGGECPNGGVWFYEITGELEKNPALLGYFNIDEVRPTTTATGRCTAHVFDVHEDKQIATIAWYNAGARVLDLSGLTGIGIGGSQVIGDPVTEIGFGRFPGSDTWAAKTPKIHPVTGDFYLYANDIERGLDIWKFEGAGKPGPKPRSGRWMSGSEAQARFSAQAVSLDGYRMFCLVGGDS